MLTKVLGWLSVGLGLSTASLIVLLLLARAGWRAESAKHQVEIARIAAQAAAQREAFERNAREVEQKQAKTLAEIAAKHEQEKQDASVKADRTIADLRSGNLRLRQHWQGCIAASERVPGAGSGSGELDAADRLREASAGRIVRLVSECQAQRDGLIGVVEAR